MSSTTDDDPALVQALGLVIDNNLSRLAAQSLFYGQTASKLSTFYLTQYRILLNHLRLQHCSLMVL